MTKTKEYKYISVNIDVNGLNTQIDCQKNLKKWGSLKHRNQG